MGAEAIRHRAEKVHSRELLRIPEPQPIPEFESREHRDFFVTHTQAQPRTETRFIADLTPGTYFPMKERVTFLNVVHTLILGAGSLFTFIAGGFLTIRSLAGAIDHTASLARIPFFGFEDLWDILDPEPLSYKLAKIFGSLTMLLVGLFAIGKAQQHMRRIVRIWSS